MLKDKRSLAIVAVSDLDAARRFYGETLGLDLMNEDMGVLVYRTGNTELTVYPSEYAGTNRANAVVWACGDELESIVQALRDRGVSFEHYDMQGASFENGIHRMDDFRAAWFKDPDGNILHLNSA